MKILDAVRINSKKLKYRTSKALFLIIPITVLVALSMIISSQVQNFQKATDESIFGEIEEEGTLLELQYEMDPTQGFRGMMEDNQFSEGDVTTIESINNVVAASMNYTLPISSVVTDDLFDGIEIPFNQISVLDEDMSDLYTDEEFTYDEGDVIPIVLNASTFNETYQDWEGEDEITIDMSTMRPPEDQDSEENEDEEQTDPMAEMRNLTPIKTRAIDYDKDDLIGEEFTITFGGYRDVNDYEVERSMGEMTFTKLSDEEVAEAEELRAETVGEYWDYEKLSKGVTYTFKVVGVIEDIGSRSVYIPEEFANQVMSDYIDLQLGSRNSKALSDDLLDSTYTGLKYDGTELASQSFGGPGGGMMRPAGMGPGGASDDDSETSESYEIPGLVMEVAEDNSNEVKGIYEDSNVYEETIKSGDRIYVRVDSIYDRTQVVEDLNELGYAYQDINNLEVFDNIQDTLNKVSIGLMISFIGLTVAVIILTMSKFVSDGRKEIGIFRAVGFTKRNILTIFLSQSLLYTAVGYVVGVLVGIVGNLAVSPVMGNWFDKLVTSTVKETFNVVNEVDYSTFTNLDINSVAILSVILLVVSLVISLIPSIRASNISPVEAIKNE